MNKDPKDYQKRTGCSWEEALEATQDEETETTDATISVPEKPTESAGVPSHYVPELDPSIHTTDEIIEYLRSGKYDEIIKGGGPLPVDDIIEDILLPADEDYVGDRIIGEAPDGTLLRVSIPKATVEGPKSFRYKASDIEKAADNDNQPYGTYLLIHHIDRSEVDPDN